MVFLGVGGFLYRDGSSGYRGECFQYIAIDVVGPESPDMTGIAAWTRVPDDGHHYYSSDCSDESRAD